MMGHHVEQLHSCIIVIMRGVLEHVDLYSCHEGKCIYIIGKYGVKLSAITGASA